MPSKLKWALSILVGLGIIVIGFRWLPALLNTFFVLNCLVLIVVVLLQSGKAADLAGAFGGAGSQTAFGPRGAASVLSQATTWCAVMFMVCAMAMVVRVDRSVEQGGSILQKFSKPAAAATKPTPASPAPATPAPQPQSSTPQPQSSTPQQPAPSTPKKP